MQVTTQGKRALITGGNTGIGASIAASLSAAGARVCVNYLEEPGAMTDYPDFSHGG